METQIKPNKQAFIISRIFIKIFFVLILVVALFVLLKFIVPDTSFLLILLAVFAVLSLIIYVLEIIVYNKLFFIFYEDKIVEKGGSLFTNYETELKIKNITHLRLRLPFIENKIFHTGHIDIESAGTSASEIHLCSITELEETHTQIISIMKMNGFNLDKGEVLISERPNSLGVFFEVFKSFVLGLFIVYYVISGLLYDEDGNKNEYIYNVLKDYIFPIIGLGILLVLIIHIFKYLDLKKRVYDIYRNVITYREGFLSKNYSMLPFQNLTDSGVTQTLVDKIFNLYDVKLSCQGSGQEILFKNISNGKAMSEKLDELIANKSQLQTDVARESLTIVASEPLINKEQTKQENLDYDISYTEQLAIDFNKTVKFPFLVMIASFFLLILTSLLTYFFFQEFQSAFAIFIDMVFLGLLFIFGIALLVALLSTIVGFIKYQFTKFGIKEKSVTYKYNFLNTREVEFKADKVTGVKVSRSFIDDWFNTETINFWSIGASSSLVFSNIKRVNGQVEKIVAKFGIRSGEELFNISPQLKLSEYLKSALPVFIIVSFLVLIASFFLASLHLLLAFAFIIGLGIIFTLSYLYSREYYKRTKIQFLKDSICYEKGWLFRKTYYAKYRDIKNITTTRYPFSSEGNIRFDVAGESIVQTGNSAKQIVSNNFTIEFVPDIKNMDEIIDYLFYKRPAREEMADIRTNQDFKNLSKSAVVIKPSLKNVLTPFLLFLIPFNAVLLIIFSLSELSLIVLIISIILFVDIMVLLPSYLVTIMTTYIMDGYRVLLKSGVIYKKQTSVIYDKIDFINNSQGFWNKVFKNGNVTVNTVGSSRTELNIKNIPNYKEFYEKLKKQYEKN